MLLLTLNAGRSLNIGPNVSVLVTEIKGDKVTLGITAEGLTILRDDLILRHGGFSDAERVFRAKQLANRQPGALPGTAADDNR